MALLRDNSKEVRKKMEAIERVLKARTQQLWPISNHCTSVAYPSSDLISDVGPCGWLMLAGSVIPAVGVDSRLLQPVGDGQNWLS